ncbi:uncharacterized protein [Halyomorpha halys]|uniref:uncharacterized protein n=1 Tax=Halyomorpha halys TaxID=286706 RepID=UPI000D0C849D|nr:uncharacterized protein LOC112210082 [Halyomorpha halys]
MKWPKLLVSLFLWICIPDPCRSGKDSGLRFIMHEIEDCEETGTHQIYATRTKISKVNRNQLSYSTNITTEVTIDDKITGFFDVADFENGEWRPHYISLELPRVCSSMEQIMPDLYNAMVQYLKSPCPIPPGSYEVKDLDLKNFNVQNIAQGKYRTDVYARINGTLIGCIRYYFDVVSTKGERQKKPRNNS